MARITKEEVKRIADVSRLHITDDELEKISAQLDEFIELAETLNEVDTTGVEPTTHVFKVKNVMREDIPEPGMDRDLLFKNAPDHQDGQFKVPAVLD